MDIVYTNNGYVQVAEIQYVTGRGEHERTVRLVVRRTRFADGAQQRLWPHWWHYAFITNTGYGTVVADEFYRGHAVVEFAIRDLEEGSGLEHVFVIVRIHYLDLLRWLRFGAIGV